MTRRRRNEQVNLNYTSSQISMQEAATWIRQAEMKAKNPKTKAALRKISRALPKLHDLEGSSQ